MILSFISFLISTLVIIPLLIGWILVLFPIILGLTFPILIIFYLTFNFWKYFSYIFQINEFKKIKIRLAYNNNLFVKFDDYFPKLISDLNSYTLLNPLKGSFIVGEKLNLAQYFLPTGFSFLISKYYFLKSDFIYLKLIDEENLDNNQIKFNLFNFISDGGIKLDKSIQQLRDRNNLLKEVLQSVGFIGSNSNWNLKMIPIKQNSFLKST